MRITKNLNVFITQGNYGQGWEDEGATLDRKQAREELKLYQQNSQYPARIIKRRVPRDKYEKGEF